MLARSIDRETARGSRPHNVLRTPQLVQCNSSVGTPQYWSRSIYLLQATLGTCLRQHCLLAKQQLTHTLTLPGSYLLSENQKNRWAQADGRTPQSVREWLWCAHARSTTTTTPKARRACANVSALWTDHRALCKELTCTPQRPRATMLFAHLPEVVPSSSGIN